MLMPSSVPEYKVEILYSGTGTVPEFWLGYLKKRCVHISAHQESFSGTVLGHQVWTQPNKITAVFLNVFAYRSRRAFAFIFCTRQSAQCRHCGYEPWLRGKFFQNAGRNFTIIPMVYSRARMAFCWWWLRSSVRLALIIIKLRFNCISPFFVTTCKHLNTRSLIFSSTPVVILTCVLLLF